MKRRRDEVDPRLPRLKMVERDVIERGIDDERVIAAMREIPRHLFVDEALAGRAYGSDPLPIGSKQTISRPHTVALMSALLSPEPDQDVLEIGTGSGYQAAVLSYLAARVHTVERIPALVRRARRLLAELGFANVAVHESDGTLGLPDLAPFDRILVTAGAPGLPEGLFDQLAEGGRMVVPVADEDGTASVQVVERVHGVPRVRRTEPCAFVPLIGAEGYPEPPEPADDPWLR